MENYGAVEHWTQRSAFGLCCRLQKNLPQRAIFGAISGKYIDPVDVGKAIINAVVIAIALTYIPVFVGSVQEATRELGSVTGWVVVIIIHIIVPSIAILNCILFDPDRKDERKKLFNHFRKLQKH